MFQCIFGAFFFVPERAAQTGRRLSPNRANSCTRSFVQLLRFPLLLGGSIKVRLTLGTRLAYAQLSAQPIRIKFGIIFLLLSFIIRVGIGIVRRSQAKPAAPKGLFLLVHQLASLLIVRRRLFVLQADELRRNAGTVKFVCLFAGQISFRALMNL